MSTSDTQPNWLNQSLGSRTRARALYDEMTIAERLSQLGSCWVGVSEATGDVAPMQEALSAGAGPLVDRSVGGLGHITRAFGTKPITSETGVNRLIEFQQTVMEGNRFGIPAIAHEECLTGFTAWGATVYPAAIAWGATWNPDLIEQMANAIGTDMASVGVHQGLSPLLDVVRDYRWGRVEETIGEDPLLVGMLGSAYVRGLQSAGIIATLKHFGGYPAGRGGRNHAPVSMGQREFRDIMLTPFEMAVRYGKTKSVMNSYSDVDGVPPAADRHLLTTILRDEWGFDGTVVSDYWAITFLRSMHKVAETLDDAALMALHAGLDVELPDTSAYGAALLQRIESGEISPDVLELSVLRVLRQKIELGLLDGEWNPSAILSSDTARHSTPFDLDSEGNRNIARTIAEQSIVLLDNAQGLLPFAPDTRQRIAVIGPTADDCLSFMGCYSFPNHVLAHHPDLALGIDSPSLLASLRLEFPTADIEYALGVPIRDADTSGIEAACALASSADVVILAVGDRAGLFGMGTSGEGTDTSDLHLPGAQHSLVEAVIEANVNTILVAITGRPYAIADFITAPSATLQAFMPGQLGGGAIAGVLSGRTNPSGKLPVQIPHVGSPQPSTYLQAPLGLFSKGVSNIDPTPAHSFGHGLSYTTFELTDLGLSANALTTDGSIEVSVSVKNTGALTGTEVVQVYLRDLTAQTVRPAIRLVAFQRVDVAAHSSAQVAFTLHAEQTSFFGLDMTRIVEPGWFTLSVGTSAANRPLTAKFEITGSVREVGRDWVMASTATISTSRCQI